MSTATVELGAFTITDIGDWRAVQGQTIGKVGSEGHAYRWLVRGPSRLRLDVEEVLWDDGTWEVRCVNTHGAHKRFDRLTHGLRMGVYETSAPGRRSLLRIARMQSDHWSTMFQTSLDELSIATGLDPIAELKVAGAKAVGKAADVVGAVDRTRNELTVTFDGDDTWVPVVAWTLTRCLPIQRRWVG